MFATTDREISEENTTIVVKIAIPTPPADLMSGGMVLLCAPHVFCCIDMLDPPD